MPTLSQHLELYFQYFREFVPLKGCHSFKDIGKYTQLFLQENGQRPHIKWRTHWLLSFLPYNDPFYRVFVKLKTLCVYLKICPCHSRVTERTFYFPHIFVFLHESPPCVLPLLSLLTIFSFHFAPYDILFILHIFLFISLLSILCKRSRMPSICVRVSLLGRSGCGVGVRERMCWKFMYWPKRNGFYDYRKYYKRWECSKVGGCVWGDSLVAVGGMVYTCRDDGNGGGYCGCECCYFILWGSWLTDWKIMCLLSLSTFCWIFTA